MVYKENDVWRQRKKGSVGQGQKFSLRGSPRAYSYATSTRGIVYVHEMWLSSNTVPTNGPRLGFPYYDTRIPGAFTAEGIHLSRQPGMRLVALWLIEWLIGAFLGRIDS